MIERDYKITSAEGIHARPASLLVAAVTPFTSEVQLVYKEKQVNMKSIMGVMSLGIKQGTTIRIIADGVDEENLMNRLEGLIKVEGLGV